MSKESGKDRELQLSIQLHVAIAIIAKEMSKIYVLIGEVMVLHLMEDLLNTQKFQNIVYIF